MQNNACIVFLKYPEAGRVKTRLGSRIGMEKAAEIYKKLAETTVKNCKSDKYALFLAIEPFEMRLEFEKWLGKYDFIPQKGSDLGERMKSAMEYAFKGGFQKCVIAGSDIPLLNKDIIENGLAELDSSDAVFGKAKDGGYYLVGMSAESKEYSIFTNMIWSTDSVLEISLKRLGDAGKSCQLLQTLADIDTEEDLKSFGAGYA